MDFLHISDLRISTHIGVHDWEQAIKQTLLLDITIPFDCSACDDRLENTLDYDAICNAVTEYVQENRFYLIETVANNVAQLVRNDFKAQEVTVTVNKPHAIGNAKGIKITVTR